jgi:predicted LPLAT superfamily acyltransferase
MNKSDLSQLGKIALLTVMAWSTPPRLWRKVAATLPNFGLTYPGPDLSAYQRILGPAFDANALADLNEQRRICSREALLQILGLNGPWRSWCPEIRLHGEAQLRKALDDGKGAILWQTDSAYSSLIWKMALHRAGYRAANLTRPSHGSTMFGVSSDIRFLNLLWTRVEDRFVGEHVVIQNDSSAPALATLRARVTANGVVLITVGAVAHRFVEVPFFQHSIRLPTGPIRLMRDTGAALLPLFVFADDHGRFDVTIERALPRFDPQGAFDRTAAAYAKRLEPYVRKYPEQWTGWNFMLPNEQSAAAA